jgi:RND family efflux transporter MFP subunit
MVGPGVPLAIVTAPSPLIAKVQIAERDLGAIRPSQTTAVSVASYPTENFSGTIRRISPMLDPITRMAELEVLLPNSDQRLKAGMFARIKIEVDRRENALMVPSNAVLQEARLQASGSVSDVARTSFLFIVQGDKAVRKNVTLGYTTGDRVEILSGIAPEDNIIIQGQSFLQNGQRVALLSK